MIGFSWDENTFHRHAMMAHLNYKKSWKSTERVEKKSSLCNHKILSAI